MFRCVFSVMSDGCGLTDDDREREYSNVAQIYNILELKLKHLATIRSATAQGTLDDAVADVHDMEEQTVKIFAELMVKKHQLQANEIVLPVDISNNPTIE